MAGLHVPLPTLRRHPRECLRTARGHVVRYSFIVVDLHHLLLAGLPAHLRENSEIEFAKRKFRLDFNQFEKQKRCDVVGQDNRENDFARFSCAHVFTQPGQRRSDISECCRSNPAYPLTSHAGAHLQLRRRVGSRKAPGLSPTTLSVGLAQKTRELFRATCVQSISTRQTAKMSVT